MYPQRPSVSPSRLLQVSRPPWFLPGQQQDCSEFLKYLLDRLHEDEKGLLETGGSGSFMRSLSTSSSGSVSPGGTLKKSERKVAVTLTSIKMKTDDEISRSGSQGSDYAPPSLVESTFRGKVKTTLRCLACKAESVKSESFSDIPLAFPNCSRLSDSFPQKSLAGGGMHQSVVTVDPSVVTQGDKAMATDMKTTNSSNTAQAAKDSGENTPSIHTSPNNSQGVNSEDGCHDTFSLNDLIAFYLKTELLTGDNKYHCEKCGKLQDGKRSITISESPNYLILSLLRFSYNIKLQSRTKIFQDVRYPRTLALPVDKSTRSSLTSSASSSSLSKQHSRNSSNSSGTYAQNMLDSNHAEDALNCEKFKQLAQRLNPKTEDVSPSSKPYLEGQQQCELYGLSAVVVHSGTSSECGHYYCYARHSRCGQVDPAFLDKIGEDIGSVDLLPDRWYNFNDSRVSHAKFETFR